MENIVPGLPQEQQEFTVGVDIVPLPSKGKFYKDMNYVSELNVQYMTTKDEALLLTPGLINSGTVFDVLLEKKIKTKGVNPSKLLIGDQFALLLFLRMTAYGPEYPLQVFSPYANAYQEHKVNLTLLKEKELKLLPDDNLQYSYTFKGLDKTVNFTFLTVEQEKNVEKKSKQTEQISKVNEYGIDRIKAMITSLDGNTDKSRINRFIETLPPFRFKELKKYIDEVEPGIDMNYIFTCQATGNPFQAYVNITSEFFYPTT